MPEATAEKTTGAEDISWDLSDLYAGIDDPTIDRDLDDSDARAAKLGEKYRGRIADLNAQELSKLVQVYEALIEQSHKVGGYAYLNWSIDTGDAARGALRQKTTERGSRLEQELVFVELEWANTPDDKAKVLMEDSALAGYYHWLEVARQRRPHLLTEPEEKILSEKSVTGRNAWIRFFDEVHGAARYEWEGEMVPLETALNRAYYDPDREVRKAGAATITAGLHDLSHTMTYTFNTILADKASDDRLRSYSTWISSRNMDNQVDDASVQALVDAVVARYDIVARYYKLKKKLLGLDELVDYDRYAPLPATDREYTWNEARDMVLSGYGQFHPHLSEIAQKFFDNNWIDGPVRPGKVNGAYSAGMTPSTHPYVLMNYEGRTRDVMTLAHELGHGVHQYLSRQQGLLHSDTPLTMAETASVFGEMLIFQDLMKNESDPAVRLSMLTGKIEDSFATVFRQISMNRFEDSIHTARREEGELATERLSELWMESQKAMFGDSVTLTEDYSIWWSYVLHFIHFPGYVYAYSYGNLLVLALYARYQEVGSDFTEAYLEMLSAGGSDWPTEIVKPLGVDLTDANFWSNGLQMLDDMVADAEKLAEEV